MKIPTWLLTIICGAVVAIGGFCGKIAWDDHTTIASHTASVEKANNDLIEHKTNEAAVMAEWSKRFDKIDNTLQYMNEKIDHMNRRNERPQ